ncbi:MAG: GNAT family N-acetyltransferase [Pseudomonadales bacterium]|nr:GNAT family N-acetyltransferase [Pseudomonadales bacterium]MBO6703193.1 GNAT family N-acetyltransferase [Pseudomonadales bacterium]MBO7006198.1 GNAT family N-acetyltransferase [Pseudomonadales bacterium]
MKFRFETVEGYPREHAPAIESLARTAGMFDGYDLASSMNGRDIVLSCLAYCEEDLVGFKLGFGERVGYFQSWMGMVAPTHRRKGLAQELTEAQHSWCLDNGFHTITAVTTGDNHAMLITNIRAGFNITGTYLDRDVLKVVLQKNLAARAA